MGWMDGEGLVHDVEKKKKYTPGIKREKKEQRGKRERNLREGPPRERTLRFSRVTFFTEKIERKAALRTFGDNSDGYDDYDESCHRVVVVSSSGRVASRHVTSRIGRRCVCRAPRETGRGIRGELVENRDPP